MTLTVTDNDGTTATTSQTVSVNKPPRAAFSVSPQQPAVGQMVTFDASNSSDPNGAIDRYMWTFDGGESADATGSTTTRQYDSPHEFTVTLTVVGSNGLTDTAETTITVVESPDTTTTRSSTTTQQLGSATTNDGDTTPDAEPSPAPISTQTPMGPANSGGGSNGKTDGSSGGLDIGTLGTAAGGAALLGGGALWLRNRSNDEGDHTGITEAIDDSSSGSGSASSRSSTGDDRSDLPSASRVLNADFDDFEQIELLGLGGSGDVHKARIATNGTDRLVALKTPRVHNYQTIDSAFADEFLQEAETWSEIDDHDHVVNVLDWGHSPQPWIAMEYMDGNSLAEHLPLDLDDGIEVLTAVADATQYAHRHGIAHGDLKPENVLFRSTDDGHVVKVGDWGLAKVLLDHSDSTQGLTPAYAAPEQFEGSNRDAEDHQLTDIYQLGALAYAAFTGQPPYEGSPAEVMNKVLNEAPTPPSEIDPSLPSAVDQLLLQAMSKNPADRYPTAQHFHDALNEALDSL